MVLIVQDWKLLREHLEELPSALLIYKVDQQGAKARLRVKVGMLGLDRFYDEKDDEFDQVMRFLDEHGAVVVKEQRLDEVFFM